MPETLQSTGTHASLHMVGSPAIAFKAGAVELVSEGPNHRTPVADRLANYFMAGRRGKAQVHSHHFLEYWGSEAVCDAKE